MTQSNDSGRITTQDVERLKAATPRLGRRLNPYLREVVMKSPPKITQAHRDEIVRHLQFGALSFRGLCAMLHRSIPINLEPGGHGEKLGRVDRGLTRRALNSAVDRGEVIAVLVRRPGQSVKHRERRSYYVYAPARPVLANRAKVRHSPRPVFVARGEARRP